MILQKKTPKTQDLPPTQGKMISFKSRDNLLAFIANFLRSGMGMFLFLRSGMGLFLFWDHCTFDYG